MGHASAQETAAPQAPRFPDPTGTPSPTSRPRFDRGVPLPRFRRPPPPTRRTAVGLSPAPPHDGGTFASRPTPSRSCGVWVERSCPTGGHRRSRCAGHGPVGASRTRCLLVISEVPLPLRPRRGAGRWTSRGVAMTTGFEPATSAVTGPRSHQAELRHQGVQKNRPPPCGADGVEETSVYPRHRGRSLTGSMAVAVLILIARSCRVVVVPRTPRRYDRRAAAENRFSRARPAA